MEMNKIYNMDCLEGLKQIATDSVDVVVTSPPYNINTSFRSGEKQKMYAQYNDNLLQKDYEKFIEDVLKELIRVTKHYVFFNFQLLSNNKLAYFSLFNTFKDNIKDVLIWHKKQFQPAISKTCLSSAFEFIVVFCKKEQSKKRTFERAFFNGREKGGFLSNVIHGDNAVKDKAKLNNCEQNNAIFPEYFVRFFLDFFTKENDIVLDPFMGLGTTAVVCKKMKRQFLGFEIDAHQIEFANSRLNSIPLSLDFFKEKDSSFNMTEFKYGVGNGQMTLNFGDKK